MKTIVATLVVLMFCGALIRAQDETFIADGETVQSEITVRDYEVRYRFEGSAGDVIRVVLKPKGQNLTWSGWYQPEILLLDSELNLIEALHSYDSSVLVHELESTGEYIIVATGWGGQTKDNVGKLDLTLEKLPVLVDGQTLECEVSAGVSKHYAVRADRDFSITYHHIGGALRPNLLVNVIARDPYRCAIDTPNCQSDGNGTNMHPVARLDGAWLESGTIEVNAKRTSSDLYIIEAAKGDWAHFENVETANFTLELNLSDSQADLSQE